MTLSHSGLQKRDKKGASYSNTGNPTSLNAPKSPRTPTSMPRRGDPWMDLIGHIEPDTADCEGAFTAPFLAWHSLNLCSCLSGHPVREPKPNPAWGRRRRRRRNGGQHVTDPRATVDSMLHLLRDLAVCFWCAVLLHHRAVADEEAPWGPTPPRETSTWWPKPDGPFRIPFYGSSDDDRDAADLKATTVNAHLFATPQPSRNHPGNSKESLLDPSGSGDESSSEASEASAASLQPTNVANTGSDSLPTGTSDFPHGNNDSLVPDSHTPAGASVRNTLFTSPTSTSSPEQHAKQTRPPWGTTQAAGSSMGAEPRHLPGDVPQRIYSTVAPETTAPTALTWAEARTTSAPGLMEGLPTGLPSPGPVFPQTAEPVGTPQYSIITDATVTEIHNPWGASDPSVTETASGQEQEQAGVITISMVIDRTPALESLTSTTPSQRVKVPIAGGKQSQKAVRSFNQYM